MAFDLTCPADLSKLRIVGTDSDVTWAEVVDHPGGVDKDGGGTEPVSTFVTETVENGVYIIHKDVEFGDGTNSLTFNSLNEMVYFVDGEAFEVKNLSTLNFGEKYDDWGQNGSMWSVGPLATTYFTALTSSASSFNMYASQLSLRADQLYYWGHGTHEFNKAIISGSYIGCKPYFKYGTYTIKGLFLNYVERLYIYDVTISAMDGFHIHHPYYGVEVWSSYTLLDMLVSSYVSSWEVKNGEAVTVNVVNPLSSLTLVSNVNTAGVIKEQYSCDIWVVDEDGLGLDGVDIACHRTSLVVYDSKVWRAKQSHSGQLPQEGDYWEDVSDIHDTDGLADWSPTLTYEYDSEVFDEKQRGQIEVTCQDNEDIEGTYAEQDSTYNGEPTYKLTDDNYYIWKGATWWTLSAEVGNTSNAYVSASTDNPYANYEPPAPYEYPAVAVREDPQQIDTQSLDRMEWQGTSELEKAWEYKFTFEHNDYPELTIGKIPVAKPIDWRIDMGLSTSDVADALESALESNVLNTVGKIFVNKAVQNKNTGVVQYYDDDGETVILTHTPSDEESEITRTPS